MNETVVRIEIYVETEAIYGKLRRTAQNVTDRAAIARDKDRRKGEAGYNRVPNAI